ncbi:MAG TPA: hypothetical protein VNU69_01615 [Rhizomicrobium sp.]|jgi:hypothetical protein|nr:hypothetical protein [Rhizomicrobium sp.]
MRTVAVMIAAALGIGAAVSPAAAAGPFDGKWIADIPAGNGPTCNYTSTLTLIVADGALQGRNQNPGNFRPVQGHVEADGTVNFTVGTSPGTGKFTTDHFDITWFNGHCDRHALGNRAPDAGQQAAMAGERKNHQAAYADLMRRAQAGEKIDTANLRAEYVYDENWDFYGNKVNGRLSEADAAAKGGDCAGALEKTDEILKIDFTNIRAHEIRSQCLEAGDRAQSRIESGIAHALDDSLMASGDGDGEKTAYVVSTMNDELHVLAARKIQIKARQTEVRGSDGHYYDEVQGISIHSGFGAYGQTMTSASVKTVYFNVDSFVKGRESHRAAVATAAATIQ